LKAAKAEVDITKRQFNILLFCNTTMEAKDLMRPVKFPTITTTKGTWTGKNDGMGPG